jgi:cysteinyl-tRNA synthetase
MLDDVHRPIVRGGSTARILHQMRLYNSLTRQVEEVKPADGRTVKMYTCGPTVYRYAHVGNFRTFMLGDLIRRVLRLEGQKVLWVMNITDVGHMTDEVTDTGRDRMELAEADEGLSAWEIAEKYTRAFLEDADALNIQRADVYPKATDHVPEMIELTLRLIESGHAYVVDGNVYFDVASFPDYGRLSGNTVDALRAGHRQELETDPNKRHPADFALWKRAGAGRVMKWDSPWGEGFPGWHIECSAMSMKYLGDHFDIHTGGNDLKFPHHEDEIAQSEGATGHTVVDVWVHGGHLQFEGKKMSKSARNIQRVTDLAEEGIDPLAFRLLCFGTRYRSEMDLRQEALDGANSRLTHLRQRMAEWNPAEGAAIAGTGEDDRVERELDRRFRDAVAGDLDMPQALVALNEAVTARLFDAQKYLLLASWDRVLGLDLERLALEAWQPTPGMLELVRRRDESRRNREFAEADRLRDELTAMGLEVMDTPEGTKIRPRR